MVPLSMRGDHCTTKREVVLPSVYVLDEKTWRTKELIREKEEAKKPC